MRRGEARAVAALLSSMSDGAKAKKSQQLVLEKRRTMCCTLRCAVIDDVCEASRTDWRSHTSRERNVRSWTREEMRG